MKTIELDKVPSGTDLTKIKWYRDMMKKEHEKNRQWLLDIGYNVDNPKHETMVNWLIHHN